MKKQSLDNFSRYFRSNFAHHPRFVDKCHKCLIALRLMYTGDAFGFVASIVAVFELCHDLDLFRDLSRLPVVIRLLHLVRSSLNF